MLDTPEVACTFCGFKSEEPHVASTPSGPRARPPAGRFTPELVRWCQKEGPLIVFSNEVQRYWMKPNVHGSVPLSSLELRFEDAWIA